MTEILLQVLALVPTVAVAAVVIRTAVEFGRTHNWIKDGQALLWNLGLNALAYGVLFVAGQLGYTTQVEAFFMWFNTNVDTIVAVASLVVAVAASTGATKLFHETMKWVNNLDVVG